MKTIVALVALFAVALAATPSRHLLPAKQPVHQISPRAAFAPATGRLNYAKPSVHQISPRAIFAPATGRAAFAKVPRAVAPGSFGSDVVIVKENLHDNIGTDGYRYNYELSDGSARDESAQVEVRGVEDAVLRVTGSYQFVGEDGQTYTVTYVADENGFQPQGAHLPVPPQLR